MFREPDNSQQQIAGSVIINTGKTPARTVHAIIVIYERAASGYPTVVDESWMNNVIVQAEEGDRKGSGCDLLERVLPPKGFIDI